MKLQNLKIAFWVVFSILLGAASCNKEDEEPTDPAIVAKFSFTPSSPKAGELVRFTNQSQNADSYEWSAASAGFSSTETDPSFSFSTEGTYEVVLVARKGSKSATFSASITVAPADPNPSEPVAAFTMSPTTAEVGQLVTFSNQSQFANAFSWSSNPTGFSSTVENPTHTFTAAGNYTISLTATGPGGSNTITKSIVITAAPVEPVPVANFSFSPTSVETGEVVTFTNSSTNATSYSWTSSPSGFSSTAENPTHTFITAGSYEITLTATGPGGSHSVTKTVTVSDPSSGGGDEGPCVEGCYVLKTVSTASGFTTTVNYEYTTVASVKVMARIITTTIAGSFKTEFTYDASARKIRDDQYTGSTITNYVTYEYEGSSRKPKRSNSYDSNNTLTGYGLNYYNASGYLIKTESYSAAGALQGYSTFEDFTAEGLYQLGKTYDASGALTQTVLLEYQGCNPISVLAKDGSGATVSTQTNTIDSRGLLRQSTTNINAGGTSITSVTNYTYDCD